MLIFVPVSKSNFGLLFLIVVCIDVVCLYSIWIGAVTLSALKSYEDQEILVQY